MIAAEYLLTPGLRTITYIIAPFIIGLPFLYYSIAGYKIRLAVTPEYVYYYWWGFKEKKIRRKKIKWVSINHLGLMDIKMWDEKDIMIPMFFKDCALAFVMIKK